MRVDAGRRRIDATLLGHRSRVGQPQVPVRLGGCCGHLAAGCRWGQRVVHGESRQSAGDDQCGLAVGECGVVVLDGTSTGAGGLGDPGVVRRHAGTGDRVGGAGRLSVFCDDAADGRSVPRRPGSGAARGRGGCSGRFAGAEVVRRPAGEHRADSDVCLGQLVGRFHGALADLGIGNRLGSLASSQLLRKWDWLWGKDVRCLSHFRRHRKWDWLRVKDAQCLSHFRPRRAPSDCRGGLLLGAGVLSVADQEPHRGSRDWGGLRGFGVGVPAQRAASGLADSAGSSDAVCRNDRRCRSRRRVRLACVERGPQVVAVPVRILAGDAANDRRSSLARLRTGQFSAVLHLVQAARGQ